MAPVEINMVASAYIEGLGQAFWSSNPGARRQGAWLGVHITVREVRISHAPFSTFMSETLVMKHHRTAAFRWYLHKQWSLTKTSTRLPARYWPAPTAAVAAPAPQ